MHPRAHLREPELCLSKVGIGGNSLTKSRLRGGEIPLRPCTLTLHVRPPRHQRRRARNLVEHTLTTGQRRVRGDERADEPAPRTIPVRAVLVDAYRPLDDRCRCNRRLPERGRHLERITECSDRRREVVPSSLTSRNIDGWLGVRARRRCLGELHDTNVPPLMERARDV